MQARPSPAQRAAGGMKWWGWGHEGGAVTHEDKPGQRGFIQRTPRGRVITDLGRAHIDAPTSLF